MALSDIQVHQLQQDLDPALLHGSLCQGHPGLRRHVLHRVFAYAQLGYLLFGTQVENFGTFAKCMCVSFLLHSLAPHPLALGVCVSLGNLGGCGSGCLCA